jgi:hypothetical protein
MPMKNDIFIPKDPYLIVTLFVTFLSSQSHVAWSLQLKKNL